MSKNNYPCFQRNIHSDPLAGYFTPGNYGVPYTPNYTYSTSNQKRQVYRLIIESTLLDYMRQLAVLSAPDEVLGIGTLTKNLHGNYTDFVVEELFTPRQLVAPGACEFEEGEQNRIINELLERGESPVGLCFRWHSHGNGSVYFSPIDEDDIDKCDSPYVVNLVINAHNDMVARLDVLDPVRVRHIPLDIIIELPSDAALTEECITEITEKCQPIPATQFIPSRKARKPKPAPIIPKGVTKDDGLL